MLVKARYWTQETPLGLIKVGTTPNGIAMLTWDLHNSNYNLLKTAIISAGAEGVFGYKVDFQEGEDSKVAEQINLYFNGKLKEFTIDIDWNSIQNRFQAAVLKEVLKIPYGSKTTYKYLAQVLEGPAHPRQIGKALGSNPILIIIPCHRIIGSDGTNKGYAGGVERKQQLLDLESKNK